MADCLLLAMLWLLTVDEVVYLACISTRAARRENERKKKQEKKEEEWRAATMRTPTRRAACSTCPYQNHPDKPSHHHQDHSSEEESFFNLPTTTIPREYIPSCNCGLSYSSITSTRRMFAVERSIHVERLTTTLWYDTV